MWNSVVGWFSDVTFMPHGHCYLWTPSLLWMYVISDLAITAAYYSIPLALIYFVKKRRDLQFNWIFVMFSIFIFACGTTHLISVWTIWQPVYWLDAGIKALTATVSMITATLLWPLVPQLVRLPSPQQLHTVIGRLEHEVNERTQAEAALEQLNMTLEQRVLARTAELQAANEALSKEVETRKQAEARIESALHEKELLLGEIHHRVKNNLQIICALLDMHSGVVSDITVQNILRDCQNRVNSMALIHQALYQANNFSAVNFSDVLDVLSGNLLSTYRIDGSKIKLDLKLSKVELPINIAIPSSLIANELITNALKHAFPDRHGTLSILLSRTEDSFELTVMDDGIGISNDISSQSSGSLGMQLVNLLCQQLRGELVIQQGNPTQFILRVPLNETRVRRNALRPTN